MKTDELLLLCGELGDILRAFPGLELTAALAHVKQAVAEYQQRLGQNASPLHQQPQTHLQPKPLPSSPPPKPEQPQVDLQQLAALSSYELLRHLQTKKKPDLQALAAQLGLSYAQRQTKQELVQMIIKRFELKRMDMMIRTESTEYTAEASVT